jgi:autotransporter translocation and assembly factor TamB
MSRRWAWWTACGLLLVVLLALGAWRLSSEIPGRLRSVEESIRQEAAKYGLRVTYRNLRFHLLYPRVSLEDLAVEDERPGIELLRAGNVDVSLSPGRLISGESPVSRIRIRNFTLHVEEANRPLIDRLRSGKPGGAMPEILLLAGKVRIGPIGPVNRWEAKMPELRLREVKYLGRRISVRLEEASGEIVLPGEGAGRWPLPSLEADLFDQVGGLRIRRFRASGPSAILRISGFLDPARKSGDVKLSGAVDLARWFSAGAPYSRRLASYAEKGNVDFSASLEGSLKDPEGSGRLTLRNGRLPGSTPAEGELAAAVSKGKVRIESLKGKIWEGTLSGAGSYDLASGRGEGKVAVVRATFTDAPWREWGIGWRPAGAVDAEIALSGSREKVHAALSWKNPAGLQRVGGGKGTAATLRLPIAATAMMDYEPGGRISVSDLRLHAGGSTLSAAGYVLLPGDVIRLSGDFSIAKGKAADYGWEAPLSWRSLSGKWEAGGTADRPQVSVRMEARSLAAGSLPPVPLVVKLEGDPSDVLHFVADVPASVAKATATGTFTGPLSSEPFAVESAVAVRDIDFSEGSRWVAGLLATLGKEGGEWRRYTEDIAGGGTADLQVSVSGPEVSVTGAMRSPDLRMRGFQLREVSLDGEWNRVGSGESWKAVAGGKVGQGSVRLSAEGENGEMEISGTADRIDLEQADRFLVRGKRAGLRGEAGIRFAGRNGRGGWELDRLSASVPRLSVDNAVLEGVSAEGSLGAASGHFLIAARSPAIRLAADVRREEEWPIRFILSAKGVPTAYLLSAAGKEKVAAGGTWSGEAEGTVSAGRMLTAKAFPPEAVSELRFALSAGAPSVSGVGFDEIRLSGQKEGNALAGEVWSRNPDTRLAFTVNLREPFGFRVEGPFSFGTASGGNGNGEEKPRFALSGAAEIGGSLRALSKTAGTLQVRRFHYRDSGIEVSGKDISAQLSPEGVRWTGGSILAAGQPLKVSGKVSWNGDLDLRLDGKMPAAAIRLATDVFDRLDGTIRIDMRVAGKWDDPLLLGSGRLEGGVFSFRGYAQLFEDMQVDAIISREKLIFEHFEGRSGGGYLDGRGELPLRFDAHQRLYFSVDFFDMRFPYPEDFRPVLQGHAELLGPFDDFLVTGDVEIQSARYTKTLRPEKAFVDFRKRLADVSARREPSEFRVRLDINVIADGTIKIKNNLADADVRGEFKVVGDAARVIVLGAFDVDTGTVVYQGNKYELKRLSVEFQDPRRNNPRLDARAETTKGNVTVTVSVTGTLEKYEVDLTSDPPLSKNDIVSLLSLGVTTQSLAGSEGAVGAGVASSLVLGPYKGRFEEGVRGIVKLDKFAIEPSFSPSTKAFEPKFIVGKSFGEQFSVSVSTSVGTSADSSATAEYKLLENVYLSGGWESATTTTAGDLGADIKIRYRYREFKDLLRGRD